jgi:cytoskeletal protein RodZ
MEDEEGPIQLWLAQHGPVRMRRRLLKDVLPDEVENTAEQETQDEDADSEAEETSRGQDHAQTEDNLPKIPTKPNAAAYNRQQQQQPAAAAAAAATAAAKPKNVKLLSRPMGLEAELPSEVRAAHDADGNAHAELDLLMVERATGIAYPTGYKIAYSRSHGNSEWTIEIV